MWTLLNPNDRQYLVNLTKDAWLAEFMGLQAVGLMVLGKIFLAHDSMASIDTRSMDGRIYVGDHKTSIICGSRRFKEKYF